MSLHVDDEQLLTDRVGIAVDAILAQDEAGQGGMGKEISLQSAIRPVMRKYAEEIALLRAQRATIILEAETYRREVEYVAAHAKEASSAHIEAHALRTLGRN